MKTQLTVVLAILIPLSAWPSSGVEVSRSEYGDDWPFTVERGIVDCVRGHAAIFKANGKVYQLNGIAKSHGFKPINPIWRDNPEVPGLKINIGPMIDLALKQC